MKEELIVLNSLKETIRKEKLHPFAYDSLMYESTFILNIASKISPKHLSKELGLILRNPNEKEKIYLIEIVKEQILKAMTKDYEEMIRFEKLFDSTGGESTNIGIFFHTGIPADEALFKDVFRYIYAKEIFEHNRLDKNPSITTKSQYKNKEKYAFELAEDICSKLIILEVQDYSKLYKVVKNYYNVIDGTSKLNHFAIKFIKDIIKLSNIIFLENDNSKDEYSFRYQIKQFQEFSFDIYDMARFFDGYAHNEFQDKNISKEIEKINPDCIDAYIKNNKENLNNLVFITSRLSIYYDLIDGYNYKEHNLALISILELLLTSSKNKDKIDEKFTKNILLCLTMNNNIEDDTKEKMIIKEIYSYRSSITHGNYSGLKNSLFKLGKLLNYTREDYELNKNNTIEKLISKKLNFYVKNVFLINTINQNIIKLLKS